MSGCSLAPVHFSHSWDPDLHSCVSQDKTALNGMHGFQSLCTSLSYPVAVLCWEGLVGAENFKLHQLLLKAEWCVTTSQESTGKRKSAISFWFTPSNITTPLLFFPPLPSLPFFSPLQELYCCMVQVTGTVQALGEIFRNVGTCSASKSLKLFPERFRVQHSVGILSVPSHEF